MLLLKRMRRDLRKGDLRAFESRLDELKVELAWLRPKMVQVLCWRGCGKVLSIPASLFEEFSELTHKCGGLTSLKFQVKSTDQQADDAADRRGDSENPKISKSEPIQETKPQQ